MTDELYDIPDINGPRREWQEEGTEDAAQAAAAERDAMRRAYAEGRGVSPAELVRATEERLSDG